MIAHPIKPKFRNGAFVTHTLDSKEKLEHGLQQVGLRDQSWWDLRALIPVRMFMENPEWFLIVLECEDCE